MSDVVRPVTSSGYARNPPRIDAICENHFVQTFYVFMIRAPRTISYVPTIL
jgi:hypothetical protein